VFRGRFAGISDGAVVKYCVVLRFGMGLNKQIRDDRTGVNLSREINIHVHCDHVVCTRRRLERVACTVPLPASNLVPFSSRPFSTWHGDAERSSELKSAQRKIPARTYVVHLNQGAASKDRESCTTGKQPTSQPTCTPISQISHRQPDIRMLLMICCCHH
jgi:hypothetical protein